MSGGLRKDARKPSSSARFSNDVCGSVIATNADPSSRSDRKWRYSDIVSTVPPDLLDTIHSVRSRSMASVTARTTDGYVESRTLSVGRPGADPKAFDQTSGARLDPPM